MMGTTGMGMWVRLGAVMCLMLSALRLEAQLPENVRIVASGSLSGRAGEELAGNVTVTVSRAGTLLSDTQVELVLADGDGYLSLENASGITTASGRVTFSAVRAVASHRLLATDKEYALRAIVDGETVALSGVRLTLRAPKSIELVTASEKPRFIAGESGRLTVRAREHDGTRLPVKGVSVIVRLPDNSETAAVSTGEDGEAVFDKLVIGATKREKLSLVAHATGSAATELEIPIDLGFGPPDSVRSVGTVPSNYRVGQAMTIGLLVRDRFGNPLANAPVRLSVVDGRGELRVPDKTKSDTYTLVLAAPRVTNENGQVVFEDLEYVGPIGDVVINATAGTAVSAIKLKVQSGAPSQIVILDQPPTSILADSMLSTPPSIRVQDFAGNPVRDEQVRVILCQNRVATGCFLATADSSACTDGQLQPALVRASALKDRAASTDPAVRSITLASAAARFAELRSAVRECHKALGYLTGRRVRTTDTSGVIRFDSLTFVGPSGRYELGFEIVRDVWMLMKTRHSNAMMYDGDQAFNRNFVIVSAIKSVAGSAPKDEAFDIRFRFRLWKNMSALVQSDIALARQGVKDSTGVKSTQKRLVDAAATLNYEFPQVHKQTSVPERALFGGAHLRIFNSVPYLGVHGGSIELARSLFHGSSMYVGYSRPLELLPVVVDDEVVRPSKHNILLDAFVRSTSNTFFQYLNIRGSIMIPVHDRGRRPVSRIALSVPIGGLFQF